MRNTDHTAADAVPAVDGTDVQRAVALALGALRGAGRVDDPRAWEAGAGTLEWTCWETLEHLADDLFTYAVRFGLAQPPLSALLPFRTESDRDGGPANVFFVDRAAGPEGLLTVVEACGGLLVSALRSASPDTVAYHVHGPSDPEGFAAMGVVETLVHTYDIVQGLDPEPEWSPPEELCERVLRRLFPHVSPAPDASAWQVLLWATGRIALPGRPRLTEWRWYGTQGARFRGPRASG